MTYNAVNSMLLGGRLTELNKRIQDATKMSFYKFLESCLPLERRVEEGSTLSDGQLAMNGHQRAWNRQLNSFRRSESFPVRIVFKEVDVLTNTVVQDYGINCYYAFPLVRFSVSVWQDLDSATF